MPKQYHTNKGTPVDVEQLRAKGEKVLAAGNMNVNAKGDVVKNGRVVETAAQRSKRVHVKVTREELPEATDTELEGLDLPKGKTQKSKDKAKPKVEKELDNGDIVMSDSDEENTDE